MTSAFVVFEAVREDPYQHEGRGFRRVAGDAQLQRFVDAAVRVGQIDADNVDG
jgi:hypothetical protein